MPMNQNYLGSGPLPDYGSRRLLIPIPRIGDHYTYGIDCYHQKLISDTAL